MQRQRDPAADTTVGETILRIVLVLSAGVAPVLLSASNTTYDEIKLAVGVTAIGVLWVMWTLLSIRRASFSVRVPLPVWGLAGGLVAIVVSGLGATVGGLWGETLIGFTVLSSMVLLCATIVRSRTHVRSVIWALSVAATGTAVYALLQSFGIVATAASGSVISVMGNPNRVGSFLVVILPASLALVWFARTVAYRIAALAMVAIQLAALAILDHTGGVLAICLSLLFVAVAAFVSGAFRAIFRRDGWSIVAVSLVAVGVVFAVYVGPMQAILRPGPEVGGTASVSSLWEDNSGAARKVFWQTALVMFAERPWTGVGADHFQIEYMDTIAGLATRNDSGSGRAIIIPAHPVAHAHNDYLQIPAETGVWGLVAILATLVLFAVFAVRRVRANSDMDQRMELLFLFGGVVSYAVLAAVTFPTYCVSTVWPAVILAGLAGSSAYGERGVSTLQIAGRKRWGLAALAVALVVGVGWVSWLGFTGDLLLHRGVAQLQSGFPALSEATLTRSIGVDPNPREAFYYRSIARILQAEQAEAGDEAAWAMQLYEAAAEDLRRCEVVFPWPDVYLTEANLGIILGDRAMSDAAIALLVGIGKPTHIYVQALYLQAYRARQDGLSEDARMSLQTIVLQDPDYNRVYVALGDLLADQGDLNGAREQYQVALSRAQTKLADAEAQIGGTGIGIDLSVAERNRWQETATAARQEIRMALEALQRLP